MIGSNAHSAEAHAVNASVRRMNARSDGEWRAYRSPTCTPASKRSGMPGSASSRGFMRRTEYTMTPKKHALATSALPLPTHAVSAPASAGPSARETLKAIALSETACGSSARVTRSFTLACWAGW